MFFYDAKAVVAIVLLLCLCGNLVQGMMNIHKANLKMVGWLFLGVLCGQPAGWMIFHFLSSDALKLLINAMVLFSLCLCPDIHIQLESHGNAFKTGCCPGDYIIYNRNERTAIPDLYCSYTDEAAGPACYVFCLFLFMQ